MIDAAYTLEQLAKRWACSITSVRRLIREGKLPAFAMNGKASLKPRYWVLHDDVLRYEAENTATTTADRRPRKPKAHGYKRFV
jgi:hypothetical protein